jgi:acyl carrier protein
MATLQDLHALLATIDVTIDPEEFHEDVPLNQQGVDSLDVANLIFQVEQQYGITISPEQSSRLRTPSDFLELLNASPSA